MSFGFLNNLLRVIKDMFDITEGGGPTLLELLNKASVDPHQHKRTDSECSLHSVIGKTNKKKEKEDKEQETFHSWTQTFHSYNSIFKSN